MSALTQLRQVSIDDYLAGELVSRVKHEYLGGFVYAMSGARNAHNRIAGNLFASLHVMLRGQSCQPYNSDTKIRINLPSHVRFYYPDVSVGCDSNPLDDSFQDRPVVIVEVLSRKTRRIDIGEKRDAYFAIPTLRVYLLVEQECFGVSAYRRSDQEFVQEAYLDRSAILPLPEIGVEIQLADIYEGIELVPEPEEEI